MHNKGKVVASYTYDAWGVCKIVSDSTGIIARINPFRYRSYYFDTETKLYFLKTRYYDPEIGRFITIDDISYLDPETINGLNLYAYCLNNPVNRVDYTGTIAITTILISIAIGAAVGAIVGAVYGGFAAAANGQNVVTGVAIGLFSGIIMGAGAGLASVYLMPAILGQAVVIGGITISAGAALSIGSGIAFLSGFVGGAATDALTQRIYNGEINDWNSVVSSGVQWGVINTANAFLCSLAGSIPNFETGLLSGIFGSATSAVGMVIDVLKNIKNKKKDPTFASALYVNTL